METDIKEDAKEISKAVQGTVGEPHPSTAAEEAMDPKGGVDLVPPAEIDREQVVSDEEDFQKQERE